MEEFILFYNTNIEENTEWYHRLCKSMEEVKEEIKDIRYIMAEYSVRFKLYKQVEL